MKVNEDIWRTAYQTLYTSRVYGTNPLSPLSSVNDAIFNAETSWLGSETTGGGGGGFYLLVEPPATPAIPVVMMDVDYNSCRTDAVSANLFSYSGNQLHDVTGRTQSPYLLKNAFLATPTKNSAKGGLSFVFTQGLYVKISSKTLSSIQVDFADGAGFRTASWDTPVSASYTTNGSKLIKIKLTYSDASTRQCYTTVEMTDVTSPGARYSGDAPGYVLPAPDHVFAPTSLHSGGKLYIQYSVTNNSSPKKLRKPLFVVEGFDAHFVAPDLVDNYDMSDFIKQLNGGNINTSLDNAGYDLVFLDFNNGTDDIRRNASLFEEALAWINNPAQKEISGTSQNVVLGLSMGGLVARYGLARVTKAGGATDTRLLITHDTPHRGANIPLGMQYLLRQASSVQMVSYFNSIGVLPRVRQANDMLDSPAAQQMLIVRAVNEYLFVNNTFMDADYRPMVTFTTGPQPTYEFVATSLGSTCGEYFFSPGSDLINITGDGWIGLDYIVTTGLKYEVVVNSLPYFGYSNRLSKLHVWSNTRLFGFIDINLDLINKEVNGPNNLLEWDSAPGGAYRLTQPEQPEDIYIYVFGFTGAITIAPGFSFVPVTSAIDLETTSQSDFHAHYVGGTLVGNTSRAKDFYVQRSVGTQRNFRHIAWTSANGTWVFNKMQSLGTTVVSCDAECGMQVAPVTGDFAAGCGGATATFGIAAYNEPPGFTATFTWSVSTNLLLLSGQGTRAPSIKQNGSGWGTVTCTVGTPCGNVVTSKSVWTGGMAAPAGVSLLSNDCPEFTFQCDPVGGATSYTWSYFLLPSGSVTTITGGGLTKRLVLSSGTWRVGAAAVGTCGTSTITFMDQVVSCSGGGHRIASHPNPVTSDMTVNIEDLNRGIEAKDGSTLEVRMPGQEGEKPVVMSQVKLRDINGQLVFEGLLEGLEFTIPAHHLPEGVYMLEVLYNENVHRKKILIKR